MIKIGFTHEEIFTLLLWAEEATKGKFNLGDETVGLTWEEETLIKKLKNALAESKTGKR